MLSLASVTVQEAVRYCIHRLFVQLNRFFFAAIRLLGTWMIVILLQRERTL
jgi:hypothetical protein